MDVRKKNTLSAKMMKIHYMSSTALFNDTKAINNTIMTYEETLKEVTDKAEAHKEEMRDLVLKGLMKKHVTFEPVDSEISAVQSYYNESDDVLDDVKITENKSKDKVHEFFSKREH